MTDKGEYIQILKSRETTGRDCKSYPAITNTSWIFLFLHGPAKRSDKSVMFEYIVKRQVTRSKFRPEKVPGSNPHLNMPCEELQVRDKLIHDFDLQDLTPLLLIRFGYSEPMPYSFMRNLFKLPDQ